MPGFDRTGPMGMGPMTGGARGMCDPRARSFAPSGYGTWPGRGGGRGRGYRHMYWATGLPGWMRSTQAGSREFSEVDSLKDQAAILKKELDAINSRLQELES